MAILSLINRITYDRTSVDCAFRLPGNTFFALDPLVTKCAYTSACFSKKSKRFSWFVFDTEIFYLFAAKNVCHVNFLSVNNLQKYVLLTRFSFTSIVSAIMSIHLNINKKIKKKQILSELISKYSMLLLCK